MSTIVEGLTVLVSARSHAETLARFQALIAERGLTLFAEIDHAAGAREAGLALAPLTLVIFGNARGGTPLMAESALIGLDLPLKALIGEDAEGRAFVAYNEPTWLGARHGLGATAEPVLAKLTALLEALATASTR